MSCRATDLAIAVLDGLRGNTNDGPEMSRYQFLWAMPS
jgi:hypothetical protein